MAQEPVELDVSAYMTRNPITVSPDVSFFDAVTKMYKNVIGNLIVVKHDEPIGLISERQILQYLITEKKINNKPMTHVATSLFARISPNTSILDAAKIRFKKKRKLLVFDGNRLVGILTTSDMIRGLRRLGADPLIDKALPAKIYSCNFEDSLFDQIKLMDEKRIGSVIVNKDGQGYGIFTERDLINNLLAIEADMSESVGRYCSHPLITGKIGIRFKEAASIMADNKIKRLPLTMNNKLSSIVCACDLLRAFETV